MGRGVRIAIAVGCVCAAFASAAGASEPVNVHWETYLPAMPSSDHVQPYSVPYCIRPSMKCIDTEIKRLAGAQHKYGCDHRGVFATTYLELTRALRDTLQKDPHFFFDPKYLYTEDALFASIYFNSLRAYNKGQPVPPAWQIAFDTARSLDVNAAQDMLLGINAHVQNDMPFLLAALGQRTPGGKSRKPDHDVMNKILDAAYERVVRAVQARFDPIMSFTNSSLTFGDDYAGIEMVKQWRENVWRNAERLLAARTPEDRAQVAQQIQQYAAGWARMIANPIQIPGYRAQRDAYCEQKLQSHR
jgi:hypothetical protein